MGTDLELNPKADAEVDALPVPGAEVDGIAFTAFQAGRGLGLALGVGS